MPAAPTYTIHYLDRDTEGAGALLDALRCLGKVETHATIESLLGAVDESDPRTTLLLDIETLMQSPTSRIAEIAELRRRVAMGMVAGCALDPMISDVRRIGITQIAIKTPPVIENDIRIFVESLHEPDSGFGLMRYMANTVEIYSVDIRTMQDKVHAIERATNHFATRGFNEHELYDVRFALEEMANNALFHAFQDPPGKEKYSVRTFQKLAASEHVRIEFGSDGATTGFAVTDTAGTLSIKTILHKLERQHNREGMYDESGRGLYLTRMLSTAIVFNIESGRRTQVLVLFDGRRKSDRPKPLLINYNGPDTFSQWGVDPDFD